MYENSTISTEFPIKKPALYITYQAKSVGYLVYQGMSDINSAKVIGVTSKGVFLLTPSKVVIFISYGSYCSPLSITLEETKSDIPQIELGMKVAISRDKLNFIGTGIEIFYSPTAIWHPPQSPIANSTSIQRLERVREIAINLLKEEREVGLGELLKPLLGLPESGLILPELNPRMVQLQELQFQFKKHEINKMGEILNTFLGVGRGLTPSGDDLIIGALLIINRWGHIVCPSLDNNRLNKMILSEASHSTTTISQNLITCAAQGSGDERLLFVADAIFTGEMNANQCATILLDLGNSSGVDSFVGMVAVLTAVIETK